MERSRTSFPWERAPLFADAPEAGDAGTGETPAELARRVLFSGELGEKLCPRPLCHDPDPAPPAREARDWRGFVPARSSDLRFAAGSARRPPLPGRSHLVDETARGVLLHFFANHELLAAELMALALLKFPEAPAAFRQGLAETLREEQRHTRWYLARMRECGLEFGQHPLSPYFWEAVSPMECPLDYVSRLSLTFEQANLDYAQHYAAVLAEAGDPKSASILRRIYQDEIAHVGYGLRWFRQWKESGESDWSALRRRLPFPLSPSRAKGNGAPFNEEGRRAAGFDEDYIRRLALFERSRGRTPDVFLFNPEAEHCAARWPAPYHPHASALAVIRDLELLAAFLARRDDVVLLRRAPSHDHHENLTRAGFPLPEIETLAPEGRLDPGGLLATRQLRSLRPWALAPDLAARLAPLRHPLPSWSPELRELFSKVAQARRLARWMGPSHPCSTPAELAQAAARLAADGIGRFVIKRAFSTAGSGLSFIDPAVLAGRIARPFTPAVIQEGGVLLEPAHDRVFDFSVQYRLEGGRIRLVGIVEQLLTSAGGYRGSRCRTKFCKGLDSELARYLMETCLPGYAEDGELAADLAAWALAAGYEGPLGIDTYIHRDPVGRLSHRPICEVNARHTMGLVALELKRRVTPGRDIELTIVKAAGLAAGDDRPEIDAAGRLVGGSLRLTEIHPGTRFAALVRIPPPR